MTYFLKSGNRFNVSTKESMDLHESLPVGNYTVKFDKMAEYFYLEEIDSFEIKGKIYGETIQQSQRILHTFEDRSSSTGVLLTGEKGSGKTLLAKMLSVQAAKQGIPTIVINAPWCGDAFNAFIQMIEQPVIILFDEFEKVYDEKDQEKMLTLLDGVYPSKKLFILTCNDRWRVNEHIRNRPGRIYYMFEYKGLSQEFVTEYCEDNLQNKEHIPAVCRITGLFDQFNFDMLKAMVEEMNRFGETPQEAIKWLNARPEFGAASTYSVNLQIKGIEIPEKDTDNHGKWTGNPLMRGITIEYKDRTDVEGEDYDWRGVQFAGGDLRQVDPTGGKFVFVNSEGDRVVLTRVQERSFYWGAI